MAGRYFTLVADERWMKGVDALVSDFQTDAEQFAEDTIDAALDEFDRSTWGQPNTPPEVKRAAESLASGWYLKLDYASVKSTMDENSTSAMLIRQGKDILDEIVGRGFVMSEAGDKVTRENASPTNAGHQLGIIR